MRRTAPMRWIEEAEARRMRLLDTESQPCERAKSRSAEFPPAGKTGPIVARLTWRVARAARARPSAGAHEEPAEGADCIAPLQSGVGCAA